MIVTSLSGQYPASHRTCRPCGCLARPSARHARGHVPHTSVAASLRHWPELPLRGSRSVGRGRQQADAAAIVAEGGDGIEVDLLA